MYEHDMAGFCGLMGRICKVLEIPWTHEEGEIPYMSQKKAIGKWLTEKEFPDYMDPAKPKPSAEIDGVEIPF